MLVAAGAVPTGPPPRPPLTLSGLLGTARDQYGIELRTPHRKDLSVYRRWVFQCGGWMLGTMDSREMVIRHCPLQLQLSL